MASAVLKIAPEKIDTGEPEVQPVTENVDSNEIAALAYQLWQERGCPVGSDQEDWFKAEMELKGRTASVQEVMSKAAE